MPLLFVGQCPITYPEVERRNLEAFVVQKLSKANELRYEPGRGVYDAQRASALAGVPKSTLHYWARNGLYIPSISPDPYTRLWSWSDLLALRAIDWFRKGKGLDKKVSIPQIRKALEELVESGVSREELSHVVAVSDSGELFFMLDNTDVRARPGRQETLSNILHLVRPYDIAPDLLEPRPLLRIIPGKLHGEPHLLNTRIPSATLYALFEMGYSLDKIQEMYPEAATEAIEDAIDFERSLQREHAA